MNKNKKNINFIVLDIILIAILFMMLIPVPYYIIKGGGTINIDENVKVLNEYKYKGSINSAYVKESRGNVFNYLLSYIIPGYKRVPIEEEVYEDEEIENYEKRGHLTFISSFDIATKVAYDKAGINYKYSIKPTIVYIQKGSDTDIEVGDEIKSVNKKEVANCKELSASVNDKNIFETYNNKNRYANKKDDLVGLMCADIFKIEDSNIKFNFDEETSGSSAGLMLSLAIYNKLTKNDITCGKNIVGTGTIDVDGKVGKIAGVEEKLLGAYHKKADIFIVPEENYEETINYKNKKNYDIEIISVKTFDETLEKLRCK